MAKKTKKKKKKVQPIYPELINRNTQMFQDYTLGMTQALIAEKYKMSIDNVRHIAMKNNWPKLIKEMSMRGHERAMTDVRFVVSKTTRLMRLNSTRIEREMDKDQDRTLTKDEASFVLTANDRALKEARLEDNKPTEISGGPQPITVVLPAGVRRFGVMPPAKGITLVNAEPEDTTKVEPVDITQIKTEMDDE